MKKGITISNRNPGIFGDWVNKNTRVDAERNVQLPDWQSLVQ